VFLSTSWRSFWQESCPQKHDHWETIVPEEKKTSALHLVERRTEKRILVHVPVEVNGVNSAGQSLSEKTFIEDVSDLGCRFSLRGLLHQGDTVTVRILGPTGESLPGEESRYYEIIWVAPKKQGVTVGAKLVQGEKLSKLIAEAKPGEPKSTVK
jgi:hypothetical protein